MRKHRPEPVCSTVAFPPDPGYLLHFKGRNGIGHCRGVEIGTWNGESAYIQPITSKGAIGNCGITFPADPAKMREVAQAFLRLADAFEGKRPAA